MDTSNFFQRVVMPCPVCGILAEMEPMSEAHSPNFCLVVLSFRNRTFPGTISGPGQERHPEPLRAVAWAVSEKS
jgi:hypothetical protein